MLTCCGCVANAEQTQILQPCQLHDQWARATYGQALTLPMPPGVPPVTVLAASKYPR